MHETSLGVFVQLRDIQNLFIRCATQKARSREIREFILLQVSPPTVSIVD